MKRWRVSNVEAFRRFEQDDEAEASEFIDELLHGFEPSPAMLAGTAFHKALELAVPDVTVKEVHSEGHVFTFRGDFEVRLPVIRELRASKTYMVDGQPIVISGQVDALQGLRIEDHKTTSRFDPDRFLSGYQWRLYLDIFGATAFRWNVFELAELDLPGFYEVRDQHTLEQYRYPALQDDCQALVARFARFVREHVAVAA
ncbi:hypothetical protein [Hydrogenophaga sp.]